MITDPQIKVDSANAKIIAQIISKEITNSYTENKKTYDRAKRCENQYNQITKWMAENKTVTSPWKNASDYFVAMTEWIVDAIWARLMNTLFSQEPYMKAKGVESSDMAKQDGATDFVDMIFREKVCLYDNSNFFFKQMIKLPFAVMKYCPVYEYDQMISKETAQVFVNPIDGSQQMILPNAPDAQMQMLQLTANGYQPQGEQDVWVQEDVPLHEGPKLQYIRFEDYAWSPQDKRGNLLYWEADRFWMTINEMMLKVKQEKFDAETIQKIKQSLNLDGYTGSAREIKARESLIECFHWYGRLPFNNNNEVDFNDPDAIEQEVYCIVALKEEELLMVTHWSYRRKPYPDRVYIRGEYEETEEFVGRSLCEKLYQTQRQLNDFMNNIMNNAWISMQKIFVKKRGLQGEAWEKPAVYPGAMWEEDVTGDIRVLDVGDVKQIGLEIENQLIGFAERLSNITNWNLGAREEGAKPTATEFAGVLQEGNIGREPLLQKCYKIMAKLCQWTVDYYYENMPPGLERRILGDQAEQIFPTQQNMPQYSGQGVNPYWQEDDIAGQFDWVWQGTSVNSDKQWNLMVANDEMDRMMPHPMISGNLLASWEILKDNFIARGKKNWQKYLPPREAIIQEMKQMQMQAQQSQMAQGMQQIVDKKIGSKVRENLIKQKMGAPQMGAEQSVPI